MPIRKKMDIRLEYTQLEKCDFLLISGRKNKISCLKCNHVRHNLEHYNGV